MIQFLVYTTQFIVFIILFLSSNLVADAISPCDLNLLSKDIHLYLNKKYPEWKIVTTSDLIPDDRELWLEHHPNKCPGFTTNQFDDSGIPSTAVLLIPKDKQKDLAKIILFSRKSGKLVAFVLEDTKNTGRTPVIHSRAAGTYVSWDRTEKITTRFPVILYEFIESSLIMFYWRDGKFEEFFLSD